jgi:hypothetical protein
MSEEVKLLDAALSYMREQTGHGSFLFLKEQFLKVPAHIQNSLFLLI